MLLHVPLHQHAILGHQSYYKSLKVLDSKNQPHVEGPTGNNHNIYNITLGATLHYRNGTHHHSCEHIITVQISPRLHIGQYVTAIQIQQPY